MNGAESEYRDLSMLGFETTQIGKTQVIARPEAMVWAKPSLGQHISLHSAALSEATFQLHGRGPVPVIQNPTGKGPAWAVRHYRNGGMIQVLGDRFFRLRKLRNIQELETSIRIQGLGIKTPRIVATSAYPSGIFYRADLITEFAQDAKELAEILFGNEEFSVPPADHRIRLQALRCTSELMTKLAKYGIHHPDLNARNILLEQHSQGMKAILIDLDRCVVGKIKISDHENKLRRRLYRSIQKLRHTRSGKLNYEETALILNRPHKQ